jgi:hypothetical protein
VRRVFNRQIALPKVRHPGASLQRPTTTTKQLRIIQTKEEITTLLTLKLIVLTSFPWTRIEKKIVGQAEEPEIESENMELEPDLDSVFYNLDHPGDVI